MKNNKVLTEHFREQLEKEIKQFFMQNQIDSTAKLINDLSFYATNHKASQEIDLEQAKDLLNDSIALLSDLTSLYTIYNDYENNNKPNN